MRFAPATICWGLAAWILTQSPQPAAPLPAPAPPAPAKGKSVPAPLPFQAAWTITLDSKEPPYLASGATQFFVANKAGPLIARALADGQPAWSIAAAATIAPVTGDDLVFVVQDRVVHAFDQASGAERWKREIGKVAVVPLWRTGWLFIAADDGAITALRAADGSIVWKQPLGTPPSAPMAIDGDRLFVATADGRLRSLAVQSEGRVEWTCDLGSPGGHPLATSDHVFVGTAAGAVYAVAEQTGRIQWLNRRLTLRVVGHPVAEGAAVFVATLNNMAIALERGTGAQKWAQSMPARPGEQIVVDHEQLLVPLTSGDIAVMPIKTGNPMTLIAAPKGTNGARLAPPVIAAGAADAPQLLRLTLGGDEGLTLTNYRRDKK